jgi:sugar phosphate isomerase/epimerase
MIELGLHTDNWRALSGSFQTACEAAVKHRLESIEFAVIHGQYFIQAMGYDPSISLQSNPRALRNYLDSKRLRVSQIDGSFPMMGPDGSAFGVQYAQQTIRFAAELDCPMVDTVDGAFEIPGLNRDEVFRITCDNYRQILPWAEDYGVIVNVEPHGPYTTDIEFMSRLFEYFDSEYLRLNMDTGNTFIAGLDPVEYMSSCASTCRTPTSRTSARSGCRGARRGHGDRRQRGGGGRRRQRREHPAVHRTDEADRLERARVDRMLRQRREHASQRRIHAQHPVNGRSSRGDRYGPTHSLAAVRSQRLHRPVDRRTGGGAGHDGPCWPAGKLKIEPLAERLGCPWRAFSLDRRTTSYRIWKASRPCLHCAGPFCDTARPMIEACLDAGVHYLDITGEYDVIEWASDCGERAKAAGIVVMPAVGFDVVPSDCLAAELGRRVAGRGPAAAGFTGDATLSPGTMRTVWRNVRRGGCVRREGRIGAGADRQRFCRDPVCQRNASGDGDPVGRRRLGLPHDRDREHRGANRPAAPPSGLGPPLALAAARWPVCRPSRPWAAGGSAVRSKAPTKPNGRRPDRVFRPRQQPVGRTVEAMLLTPNGYQLTVDAALSVLQAVLDDRVEPGFHTPAKALGAEFVQRLPGVEFRWLA